MILGLLWRPYGSVIGAIMGAFAGFGYSIRFVAIDLATSKNSASDIAIGWFLHWALPTGIIGLFLGAIGFLLQKYWDSHTSSSSTKKRK